MSNDKSVMIEKIRKLLALAADPNAAEGEAENAARMASKLMAKHQIDEAFINAAAGGASIKMARAKARHMNIGCEKAPTYTGFIAIGVAQFTETIVTHLREISIHEGIKTETYRFGGEINDVKFAVWLCETLCYMGLQSWKKAVTDESKVAWLNGWGAAVQTRLFKMSEIRAAEENILKASDSNALIILDQKVALVTEKFGAQTKEQKNHKLSMSGYEAGMNETLPINRPLEGGQKNNMISA